MHLDTYPILFTEPAGHKRVMYSQPICAHPAADWLRRVLDRICKALEVDQTWFYRSTCPTDYVGRRISAPIIPRNKAASGQFAANASLIRVVVSLIRTAIFSNRRRMVENSPLAKGCM